RRRRPPQGAGISHRQSQAVAQPAPDIGARHYDGGRGRYWAARRCRVPARHQPHDRQPGPYRRLGHNHPFAKGEAVSVWRSRRMSVERPARPPYPRHAKSLEGEMIASRYWIGLAVFGTLAGSACAHAQAVKFPEKPVTIISDAPPGSTPDVDARFIAAGLSKLWGQQAVIINHAGANGSIAARAAAEATPDGYTLFMPALSTFVALPSVAPNIPIRLPRDFVPIGFTAENPMFVAVNPTLGVSTLPELIALAKKKPGTISIAVTGVGRLTHLTGLLLQERAGIELLPVPY